jgi:hypothetical protein
MKTTGCLVIAVMLISVLGAADVKYDIGNFRPTDLTEFSFYPSLNSYSFYGYSDKHSNSSNNQNQLNLSGKFAKEKPGYYLSLYSSSSPLLNSEKSTYITSYNGVNHTRSWSVGFTSENKVEFRKYFGKISLGGAFDSNYSQRRYNYTRKDSVSHSDSQNNRWDITNQLTASIGYGRIYECREAYIAWDTFKELDKNALLSRQYTSADIDEMAVMFYQLRSLVQFDSHKKYRQKVATLIDFLKVKGYLKAGSETNATAMLLDMWQTGSYSNRYVGTKVEAKPFAAIKTSKNATHDDYYYIDDNDSFRSDFDRSYYAKYGLELKFSDERPVLNVLQCSTNISAVQGWYNAFYQEPLIDSLNFHEKPFTHLFADYTLAYYPNNVSRIALKANTGLWIDNLMEVESFKTIKDISEIYTSKFVQHSQKFDTGLSLEANYQITYSLSAMASINGTYTRQKNDDDFAWQKRNLNTNLRLSYRLY